MKVIIAGGRDITDTELLIKAIKESGFDITEVVFGCASGADTLGKEWAQDRTIPVKPFPALWNNLTGPNVLIKYNRAGKPYNALAGFNRNIKMAEYAEALIAIWDGKSKGTKHMIDNAKKLNLQVYILYIGEIDNG